ncbi:hypothetical protein ACFT30_08390 [Microbacterium ureisolvens]|uniref:hypothetical protein n=1 Tax=Microbacterium ureisolvens TaxID=2781186 RepID=UPI00362EC8B7
MTGFLARLAARSVTPPETGRADAATRWFAADDGGAGALPAGGTAGGVRPRLPSLYEPAWLDAGTAQDGDAGLENVAERREREVTAPGVAPGGGQRESAPRWPASRPQPATTPRPPRERDDREPAPAAPEREHRRPAGTPAEVRQVGVPAPDHLSSAGTVDDVAQRVLARLARQPAPSTARSSREDPTSHASATTAEPDAAPDHRLLAPANLRAATDRPVSSSEPRVVPTDHLGRLRDLRDAASEIRPRASEGADTRSPGGPPPRPAPAPPGRARPPAAPEAPRIQVSIGRVEVRAVHQASTPTIAEPQPPAGPLTSLEEYLRQREAGA